MVALAAMTGSRAPGVSPHATMPSFVPTTKPNPTAECQLSPSPDASGCEGMWTFVWTKPLETRQREL